MPIVAPQLDDLRYDTVVEDLVRRIPVYAPTWTDYNDSDPGVALIQLFAHLVEQVGYRLNRVPELAHLALLDLMGIHLTPAGAARTELALLFGDPTTVRATLVAAGLTARADKGDPPPVFTTDADHDLVPADVRAVLSTRNPVLRDVLELADGTRESVTQFPTTPADDTPWLSVRWDGRDPKPVDLPRQPVLMIGNATHRYVWLALGFNKAPDAGFRDVRVDLRLQLDDTEQPTLESFGPCAPAAVAGEVPETIDWLHYYDAAHGEVLPVPGRIDDGTGGLSHSGTISFTVPDGIGAIPDDGWVPMQEASAADALTATGAFSAALGDALGDPSAVQEVVMKVGDIYRDHFIDALNTTWAGLGTPPALVALLDDIKQAILDRITATWDRLDLVNVKDWVLSQITSAVDTLTWQNDLSSLFNQISSFFTDPVTAVLDPAAAVQKVIDDVTKAIQQLDPSSIADETHTAIRQWVLNGITGLGPLTVPDALRQDVADHYATLAVAAVEAVFGGVPTDPQVSAIADYYKTAALGAIDDAMANPPTEAITLLAQTYADALDAANEALERAAAEIKEFVDHPLPPRYRDARRIQGWLRLTAPTGWGVSAPRLRHGGFNVIAATNAENVGRRVVGAGDGRPGLQLQLPDGNILDGTLELSVQESADPNEPLQPWVQIDDLATAGPFDRVYTLDREAGVVTFGDGSHGRVPPLVAGAGAIVVEGYRHGGGVAGNIGVGAITKLQGSVAGVTGAVNIVAGAGGRDAEDLDAAKLRARRDLTTRYRAVTAGDFEWIATQTPSVRVARAVALGLRRPLPSGTPTPAPPQPRCGTPLPDGPTGLQDGVVAHGVVSVVVVPQEAGPEPLPTASFLAAVCRWLDQHRLVTTELHVIPPQYARLCDLRVTVQALPGFSRIALQERVTADLGTHLHVLTGGDDGTGFPFGGQVHIADLIARVARVEGVDRVEELRCAFTRTKSTAAPRQGELVMCPAGTDEYEALTLGPEETVSFDGDSVLLTTVASA
jgi:Baseplate J-like protein